MPNPQCAPSVFDFRLSMFDVRCTTRKTLLSNMALGAWKFESGARDLPPEGSPKKSYIKILLKALWGGHPAALLFLIGSQLQVGERRHAKPDRRLQKDETEGRQGTKSRAGSGRKRADRGRNIGQTALFHKDKTKANRTSEKGIQNACKKRKRC